jgi:hypothetical protein
MSPVVMTLTAQEKYEKHSAHAWPNSNSQSKKPNIHEYLRLLGWALA